jgi:hypothetical protein
MMTKIGLIVMALLYTMVVISKAREITRAKYPRIVTFEQWEDVLILFITLLFTTILINASFGYAPS